MIRRFGRPGLLGTMARTAVVAGTATAVVGGIRGHQQAKADAVAYQQQAAAEAAAQSQAAAQSLPAEDDMLTQLAKLGQMKEAGLIDDAEFAAAKGKLLGI